MISLKNLAVEQFDTTPINNKLGYFVVDPLIGTTFLTVKKFQETTENILICCANNYAVEELYNSLAYFIDKSEIITVPTDELIRVEYLNESKDLLAQQVDGIYNLINAKHKIIILSPASLYKYYPTKETFMTSCHKIKVGEEYGFERLKKELIDSGYYKVSKIDQSLQFAVRGDIIDVFSINYEYPIRIEFFGDEIESIRYFSIGTQTSFEQLTEVEILPATLNLLTEKEIDNSQEKISNQIYEDLNHISGVFADSFKAQINEDIYKIKEHNVDSKLYKYFGFLQILKGKIIDFISDYILIIENEDEFYKAKEELFFESKNFVFELYKKGESLSNLSYFNEYVNVFYNVSKQYLINNFFEHENSIKIELLSSSLYSTKDVELTHLLSLYLNDKYKILCLADNKEQVKKIVDSASELKASFCFTKDFNIDENSDISISINSFIKGFEFKAKKIVVLTSKELFGYKRHLSTYSTKFRQGIILGSYQELEPGDYVVHEKNGIGRFVKIATLDIDGHHEDYLQIKYEGEDVLYVPLYQFNLIRKYVGKDGYAPKLNRLFTTKWENTKKKIKQRINDLAERLMSLYNERANVQGISFKAEPELEQEFASCFEHELTKDQESSLNDIYKDMENTKPMDRLLCGDVGFGKTEVAFRAAFRAILNNKMVILLCPTTLLARQHYEVALKRFKNFDIEIALYTRMNVNKDTKLIEEEVSKGKVHLLIGTHKVLSKKIDIKNLGLLIIDEEQRFGVEQKEKIKEKSQNIDVLTLSATPIPRTLQSSLVGLKQVSTIETPPRERLAIQTYVIPYDRNVVRELIKKEMSRHGQIFYIHNEIASIYDTCDRLLKLVPECRIGIVHGQMNKEETNDVMQDFYDGNLDLLLATSIIENGIDVENANLMLIENANHFGLAQLYQIKGRVGRGSRMAFAYLMINKNKEMNESAQKRLEAIRDLSDLGSGYKIAQRDLLIRGAGDILGPEQAGFIDAIGIDMYIQLLNETIEEKRTGIAKNVEVEIHKQLSIDAYIPSSFIPNNEKVEVYQKLLNCKTLASLEEEKTSIKDIYGDIPENMELLFLKRKVDIYLNKEDFKDLNEDKNKVTIILSSKFSDIEGIGTSLFTSFIPYLKNIKISFINKLVNIVIKKNDGWIDLLIKIMGIVDNLYEATKKVNNHEN